MSVVLLLLLRLLYVDCPAPSYSVRATRVIEAADRISCGATDRMLADRHRLRVDHGTFLVNGKKWYADPGSALPGEALLTYYPHQGNKTYVAFWVVANDRGLIGLYMLGGELPDGRACTDVVAVEGVRL